MARSLIITHPYSKHGIVFALIIVSIISVNRLFSQDLMKLSIEELMDIKITTSSRIEQEQWKASAKIIVITAEMINQRGYQSLLQVLRDVPHFQIQSEHGHWTKGAIVNMRGHRSGDSGNNKFLVLVDGIKLSDDAEEGIYMGMNSIPLNALAQIEIAYGPNSTIYGRDAYSGMINLITRKDDFSSAGINYGTYKSTHMHAAVQRTLAQQVHFNLFYSRYRSSEQDPTEISESYLNRTVYPQDPYTGVFYRASDNSALNLGFNYKKLAVRYLLYDVVGSESYGGNPNYYVTEYSAKTHQRNQVLTFSYTDNLSDDFEWKWKYTYKRNEFDPSTANLYTSDAYRPPIWNEADSSYINDPFYAYGGRKYYYFRTRAHKAQLKSVYNLSQDLKIISGLDVNYVQGIPVYSEGKGGAPIASESQRETLEHDFNTKSLYSELNYQISDNLFASAGARWDWNSNTKNTLMPRLGLIYKRKNHLFKALFSQGYLAPSISQNSFESKTTFSWIKPTNNLGPERISAVEFEWDYTSEYFKLFTTFFSDYLSDAIQESVQTGDSAWVQISNESYYVPILQSQNEGKGYRTGVDIGLALPLNKYFAMSFGYSYLNGYDYKDGHKKNLNDNLTSEHAVRCRLNLNYKKINIWSGLYWNSERRILSNHNESNYAHLVDKNGYDYFPSVFLADLNFRINEIYKGVAAYLTVRNLFDKEYYGQTINAQWGSPKVLQDLRRITIGMDINLE